MDPAITSIGPWTLGFSSEELALFIPLLAIGGGLGVAVISVVVGAIKKVSVTKHREETKRELAAYVAEGSMKPEDAEKILKADQPSRKSGDWHKAS